MCVASTLAPRALGKQRRPHAHTHARTHLHNAQFEAWSIGKDGKPYHRYLTGFGPAAMAKDLDYLLAQ